MYLWSLSHALVAGGTHLPYRACTCKEQQRPTFYVSAFPTQPPTYGFCYGAVSW
jgi:hypothetical protein